MQFTLTPSGLFAPGRGHGKPKRPLKSLMVRVVLIVILLPGTQALGKSADKALTLASVASKHIHHPREKTFMKRQWGVEVLFVRQTAAGYMLEFRYKVLDAAKAKPLFERQTKPLLTHAESGAKLVVPTPAKTGALRNSNPPHSGTTYWMFFANPGKLVKPGDHVSVEIGAFRAEGLVVR